MTGKKKQVLVVTIFCSLFVFGCFKDSLVANNNALMQKTLGHQEKNNVELIQLGFGEQNHSFPRISIQENGNIWAIPLDFDQCTIVQSIDKGQTWQKKLISQEFCMLDSIFFLDNNNGWIHGLGNIFRTSDGGKSWSKTIFGTSLELSNIIFTDLKNGYLVGKVSRYNIRGTDDEPSTQIWTTSDGGITWKKRYQGQLVSDGEEIAFALLSSKIATAVLDDKLIRTDDSGESWKVVRPFRYTVRAIAMDKSNQLWAVGDNGGFYVSNDLGNTWQRPAGFPGRAVSINWNSIVFINENLGLAVGDEGHLIYTRDGGNNWHVESSKADEDLLQLYIRGKIRLVKGSKSLYRLKLKLAE